MTVAVPVMNVGEMRVRMCHRLVNVGMRVRLTRVSARRMLVLVMLVVNVTVCVFELLVTMLVDVLFAQVQPDTRAHKTRSGKENRADRLVQ